ncbi:putative SKP1/BTB/POZ domain, NPH3 domain-containing protein [Rosa chinensis]|uniref:Putative SKP1/BTB/POZ domain, NPH3 domain-containing protein n=1 Tax=Rosa chinensis TaxID=74649 RepID=A0A2P6RP39_ROSCH|nr:BTB/POZ domain-containing protein At3g49900 [Rosa chinensis]PRQ48196.1 putative SKP1/BTB/POZ domain, NPH3 domain-containing protein [Rosa chinensis]
MRNWKNLGFVETIYEEEDDCEFSSASPSLSPAISSPSTPLHSRVESWSRATGHSTEVLIRVQGKCFQLHKDPLTSRSTYLKRQLTAFVSDFTLPLNISAETFTLVADFCYGARLVITLFNVAALRTAAELLEMTETNDDDDNNLLHSTDTYFSQVVAVNRDYASVVFRSCMPLLPEAETVAFLVSRCIEALALSDDGDSRVDWLHEVITVCPEDFQIVAEVIQRRYGSHDVVYKLVDLYIMRYNGKITEEQKAQICSSIDCSKLSPQVLLEAVQNPIMPLRFVVRAMLIEQLNTRRTILTAATDHHHSQLPLLQHHYDVSKSDPAPVTTLGSILQRDNVLRQSAQLKATMAATSSRIKTLEEELNGMKKLLEECHNEKNDRSIMAGAGGDRKSASFHYGSSDENNHSKLITKSASSSSFRLINFRRKEKTEGTNWASCNGTPGLTKSISQRLISGLKKAFRVSGSKDVSQEKFVSYGDGGNNKDIIVIE